MRFRARVFFAACLIAGFASLSAGAADTPDTEPPRLLVLDLELIGDLGGAALASEHEARLKRADERLRAELARTGLYRIVDDTPLRPRIEELQRRESLRECNGCELDLARELGAGQIFVPWVYRVSNLILTLNYEIRDAATGAVVARKSFDFRGDNDAAWDRAIAYMVRDLCSTATASGRNAPAGCR
jgi:Protein of unknown function (DUF2380).